MHQLKFISKNEGTFVHNRTTIALVNLKSEQGQDTKDASLFHVHVSEEYRIFLLAGLQNLGSHDLILLKPLKAIKTCSLLKDC